MSWRVLQWTDTKNDLAAVVSVVLVAVLVSSSVSLIFFSLPLSLTLPSKNVARQANRFVCLLPLSLSHSLAVVALLRQRRLAQSHSQSQSQSGPSVQFSSASSLDPLLSDSVSSESSPVAVVSFSSPSSTQQLH